MKMDFGHPGKKIMQCIVHVVHIAVMIFLRGSISKHHFAYAKLTKTQTILTAIVRHQQKHYG